MAVNKGVGINIGVDASVAKKELKELKRGLADVETGLKDLRSAATSAFVAIGGTTALAINEFRKFEKGLADVSTIVDTNTESMEDMGNQLLDIASRAPVALDELTTSLYQTRSAGIAASDAMDVVEQSAKLAVAGLSTMEEATNLLTSATNAFKKEGLSTAKIADILFKTVKAGKTTVSELSQAFGATAPLVEAAGVKLTDFQAATAALTTVGLPAAQAQNQIRAAVTALLKPTSELTKIYERLGVKDGQALLDNSVNLGDAFTKISREAKKMDIPLQKVVGRVEAANGVIGLATTVSAKYIEVLQDMESASEDLQIAFDKQNDTVDAALKRTRNNFQILGVEIGKSFKPTIQAASVAIAEMVQWFRGLSDGTKELISGFLKWGTIISGAIIVLTTFALTITGMIKLFKTTQVLFLGLNKIIPIYTLFIKTADKAHKVLNVSMRAGRVVAAAFWGALTLGISYALTYLPEIIGFFKELFGAAQAYTGAIKDLQEEEARLNAIATQGKGEAQKVAKEQLKLLKEEIRLKKQLEQQEKLLAFKKKELITAEDEGNNKRAEILKKSLEQDTVYRDKLITNVDDIEKKRFEASSNFKTGTETDAMVRTEAQETELEQYKEFLAAKLGVEFENGEAKIAQDDKFKQMEYDKLVGAFQDNVTADNLFKQKEIKQKTDFLKKAQSADNSFGLKSLTFDKFIADQKLGVAAQNGMDLLGEMSTRSKKAFKAQKAFNIAGAIMDTYRGVDLALATLPPPASYITAGITLAKGLASVSKIRSQSFTPAATGGRVQGGIKGMDSVPIMAMPGEDIMPTGIAKPFNDMYPKFLEAFGNATSDSGKSIVNNTNVVVQGNIKGDEEFLQDMTDALRRNQEFNDAKL